MRKAAIVYCCMRKTVHCRHAQEWNVRVFPIRRWPELGKTGKCLCSTLTLYGSQGLPSSRCDFGHLRFNAVGFHDSRWSRLGETNISYQNPVVLGLKIRRSCKAQWLVWVWLCHTQACVLHLQRNLRITCMYLLKWHPKESPNNTLRKALPESTS